MTVAELLVDATLTVPSPHDSVMPAKATEDQMLRWLWRHFVSNGWAAMSQVTVSMGDLDPNAVALDVELLDRIRNQTDRRIDMLAARRSRNPERTGPLETLAIEVKVTRADFLSDVKNPDKQAPWRSAATRHAYAVPAGLVQADEVPAGSGLLWLTPPAFSTGMPEVKWVRRAPFVPDHKPRLPFRVLLALMYRNASFEGATKGWNYSIASAGTEEEVRAALKAAQAASDKAEKAADKAKNQAEAWRRAYALAAPDGIPCAICGAGVKPHYPKRDWFRGWKHIDPAQDEPCRAADVATVEKAALAAYEAATEADVEAKLRNAHRFGFNELVDAEPWRAFIDPLRINYRQPGVVEPEAPYPAAAFPGDTET